MSKTPEIDSSPILLHVGFPKCLSSWLQKHVFEPQFGFQKVIDPIEAQLNIIDPSAFAFSPVSTKSLIAKKIQQEKNKLIPVITSEALAGNMFSGGYNGKELADRIYQIAPHGKILLIIREQRDLIRSMYKTLIVWGMPHTIDRLLDPIQPRLTPQFNLDFFCFDQRIKYYQQLFGPERVKVLAYEQFLQNPDDFLTEIHQFSNNALPLGKLINNSPINKKWNTGQTLFTLEIERLKNKFLLKSPFNANGLFIDTDDRWPKRVNRSKRNKLTTMIDSCLENNFKQTVLNATKDKFSSSNQHVEKLTDLDLSSYGYEV